MGSSRNYLLVNHVPFGCTASPNRFLVGDMWLEDLRAQAEAWMNYGRLAVAVPCVKEFTVEASGSFSIVELDAAKEGFDVLPLPPYNSMKSFIRVLPMLRHRLARACEWATIIQADYGGHPIALGQVVWPIARMQKKYRIWVFDGADPFPRLQQHVAQERNALKRFSRALLAKRLESFCRKAISDADLVFAHNHAVSDRFKAVWNERCHTFNRSFVRQSMLITGEQAAQRKERLLDRSRPLRIIVAGRQIPMKATDHVIRAMATAVERGANLELDVVGEGASLGVYVNLATDLGIAHRVRFLGAVPYGEAFFELLQSADVLAVTNLTAEISRNVLLGMALGLPLILYRNPGTDAMVEQHQVGILVPSADVESLSRAFISAAQDRAPLTRLLTNGLAFAQTQILEATHRERARLAFESFVLGAAPHHTPRP
jgi:glycosyltransferase involved in cell wall biosynthesis